MSRKKQKMPVNEWSHFINADHVDKAPKRVKIEANEQQCKDIAQRATIVDVISINADLTLEREQAGRVVHVAGRLEAILILECLCVQHLILAIPPYPRKEGAEHPIGDDSYEPDKDSPLRKNPFEALKDWKEER